jgi:hypothetical protein
MLRKIIGKILRREKNKRVEHVSLEPVVVPHPSELVRLLWC